MKQPKAIPDHYPVIALAGNPNVGKSTLFNSLTTGKKQHTGNWIGKTTANAWGICHSPARDYTLVDIPGTYSLSSRSAEEEVARDFICFGAHQAVVIVCDATCLERNLNLVLQILEATDRTLVCVNLLDEAEKKNITIDLDQLSDLLCVPVAGTSARKKSTLSSFLERLDDITEGPAIPHYQVTYCPELEKAVSMVEPAVKNWLDTHELPFYTTSRFLSLRLLEDDPSFLRSFTNACQLVPSQDPAIADCLKTAWDHLNRKGIFKDILKDRIVSGLIDNAETIASLCVKLPERSYNETDRKLDRILTGRLAAYPAMAGLLALIFWIPLVGANDLSALLSRLFFSFQPVLDQALLSLHFPDWIRDAFVHGVYQVLAWVVSVMLPPMAIFFPLFTLLEDSGYLPRIAYNLDRPFQCCKACGKQALTMAMGFGCNAAGITGCRIIDSPRERLIAMITNSFVPCNGRLPLFITLILLFLSGNSHGLLSSAASALLLTLFILSGIAMTFITSYLLSATILKGVSSSFTLELPPYRKPQIGKVIFRSVTDRTLFVLGRAAAVAAPAGFLLWIMANTAPGNISLLARFSRFLDPLGRLMGMDGVILTAFILGLPANEIVLPIILMAYTAQGSLTNFENMGQLKEILLLHGWTWKTAVCVLLFSLMHWPCSTTLITLYKETKSKWWTFVSAFLPAFCGALCCIIFTVLTRLFQTF